MRRLLAALALIVSAIPASAESLIIGLIAGIIVVFAVIGFDKIKIDDPVGAISVHLVCGIWGTLAVGIFGGPDFSVGIQLLGVVCYAAICIVSAAIFFGLLKVTVGIRVSEEEELSGLDLGEHGMEAYAGFQVWTTQ